MHTSSLQKNILILFLFHICYSFTTFAETKTITLNYNENDINYYIQGGFDIISLPEFSFMSDSLLAGEPMMPVGSIRVLLPFGMEVNSVRIISTVERTLEGEYYIYPIQYPEIVVGENGEFVEPKKEIYSSEEYYPGKLAEFICESYFREYNIAEILVYPLQYIPSNRQLILNTEINIEIEYSLSATPPIVQRLRQNERIENTIRARLSYFIVNSEDIPINGNSSLNSNVIKKVETEPLRISEFPSVIEGQNVEYIIITNDALSVSFQILADWKTKKGIVTTVKSIS
ncbi:MAG TPA: C25 family peptidase propeptide domain-containing protein, partial [Ignavibacteriaceae bacterium]|nr:C25 family peptidase propeptide domain-containing protein [Ignavibacteriaceae bacterium]